MFTLKTKRSALRKLAKTGNSQKQKIREVLLTLKNDPIPFKKADVCKLKGYDNIYRIRIGSLRLVYEILWNEKVILIHYVGPREKAYE
jgi:mRNA interferase RelE/StbE